MTMTPERIAELDAVMARATEGPWQRKSGFEKLTIIGNIDGETVESQTKYTYEMVCEVYDDNGPIVAGRNVAAIVALHNAYPDLRAHIYTQAATIARLRVLVQSAYYEGWEDAQDACSANVAFSSNPLDDWEISTSRAALTGAA